MRILIIEDEVQAAWNLQQTIMTVKPDVTIVGLIDSIAGLQEWFTHNEGPDLIFSDIQLGDGIVFDAFKKMILACPIIFCTAYDEYLLQAFKVNSIDYLLKPIDETEVKKSFEKLSILQKSLTAIEHHDLLNKAIAEIFERKTIYKTNFLIPHRDKLIPIETNQIVYFKVDDIRSEICLIDGKTYHHSFTLDYLGTVLNPLQFHRVNRQYLLSFESISEIEHHDDRKLLLHIKVPGKEKIIVSKAKASEFLNWMQKR